MLTHGIRILLIGNDFGCLRNRAKVLREAGIHATLSDPNELETHVGTEQFDLVVLCHTLSDLQRRIANESARRRWPGIKVLQLLSSRDDFTSLGCALEDAIQDSPDQMIDHVMILMGMGACT